MNTFMKDYRRALDHFGDHADSLRVADTQASYARVSHQDLALSLCVEATRLIMTKRGRRNAWSNHYDGDTDMIWMRTAWRCALSLPIGYVITKHRVISSRNQYHWCPSASGLDEFLEGSGASVLESNRLHSGPSEAYGVYRLLFCSDGDPHSHFSMMAVSSALSDRPDRDNPVYAAIRSAISCVVRSEDVSNYPFFWRSFILDNDYLGENALQDVSHSERTPLTPVIPVDRSVPQRTVNTSSVQQRSVHPDETDRLKQFADQFLVRVASLLRDGTITLNSGGSIFHVVDGDLHIIHPTGWERCAKLAKLRISGDQLALVMRRTGYAPQSNNSEFDVSTWYICPDGRSPENNVGVMRLQKLSLTIAKRLFPDVTLSENPDLIRKVRKARC